MREDIKQAVKEYGDFFIGRFDVAESLQGRLYFIEYAAGDDSYMSFTGFDTAEQLREIVCSVTGGTYSGKSENNDLPHIISDLKALNRSLSEAIEKLNKSL